MLIHRKVTLSSNFILCTGTKAYWRDDKAKDPLFTWVKDEALRCPTYRSFIALLDNYETSRRTGKRGEMTPEEIRENWTFWHQQHLQHQGADEQCKCHNNIIMIWVCDNCTQNWEQIQLLTFQFSETERQV